MIDTDMHGLSSIPDGARRPRHSAAMWFDADVVQIPNMLAGVSNFSVVATIQTNAPTSYGRIVSFRDTTLGTFFEIFLYTSKLAFFSGGAYPTGATIISKLVPTVIGITVQGSAVKYYVNGSLDYQGTFSISWRNIIGGIGAMPNRNTTFNGAIRDVVFWGRTLSNTEMQRPYAVAMPLAWYSGGGIALADWQDTSGNGYHATAIIGTPEQCLIHQRGAVIRTDGNNNRYIVT